MFLSIPDLHNLDLRRCLQRVTPAWSSWVTLLARERNAFGRMIPVPRRTMSFATHRSLDKPLKALGSLYKVFSVMHLKTNCNSGSLAESVRISSVSIALGDMC